MKILLITLAVLAVLAVPLTLLMFYGMGDIHNLVIREVDLSKLEDGTYAGSFHKGRWTYDVEVEVKDHRLVAVRNTNPRMRAQDDWNKQLERVMLERQTIRVDVVSGASINTKAFQKAVELALTQPPATH